jgi:hypothetical protein
VTREGNRDGAQCFAELSASAPRRNLQLHRVRLPNGLGAGWRIVSRERSSRVKTLPGRLSSAFKRYWVQGRREAFLHWAYSTRDISVLVGILRPTEGGITGN